MQLGSPLRGSAQDAGNQKSKNGCTMAKPGDVADSPLSGDLSDDSATLFPGPLPGPPCKQLMGQILLAGPSLASRAMEGGSSSSACSSQGATRKVDGAARPPQATAVERDSPNPDTSGCSCIACKETCSYGGSQPYGRNPFVRRCNECCANYKNRINKITAEKKASKDKKSTTDTTWKSWTPEQQAQWYRQQKRGAEDKGCKRELGSLILESSEVFKSTFGRRLEHKLVSYEMYFGIRRMAGIAPEQIKADWEAMALDPTVDRETVDIRGQPTLCLELFDGLIKYMDNAEEHIAKRTRVMPEPATERELLSATGQQTSALQHFSSKHSLGNAGILVSHKVDATLDTPHIPPHLLPKTCAAQQLTMPSTLESALAAEMLQAMREQESHAKVQEETWAEEAAEAANRIGKKVAGKAKAKACCSKAVTLAEIQACSLIDRRVAGMREKQAQLGLDADAFAEKVKPLKNESYEKLSQDIADTTADSSVSLEVAALQMTDIKKSAPTSMQDVKVMKDKSNDIMLDLLGPSSAYQRAKTMLREAEKTVKRSVTNLQKKLKHNPNAAPDEEELEASSYPIIRTLIKNDVQDLCNGVFDYVRQDNEIQVSSLGGPALASLVERMVASTYYKQQVKYVRTELTKPNAQTSQSVVVSVRNVIRDIRTSIVKDNPQFDMLISSPDCEPPEMKQIGNAWSFRLTCHENHQFIGMTFLGLDECYLGLEGRFVAVGVRIGKFAGSLRDQVNHLRGLSGKDVTSMTDFSFSFENSSVRDPQNVGKILFIPCGHIYALYGEDHTRSAFLLTSSVLHLETPICKPKIGFPEAQQQEKQQQQQQLHQQHQQQQQPQ